jgi:hypothetical protein
MKSIPDITDDAAMLLRGRRSVVASAKNEAAQALRDASTYAQGADWDALPAIADQAQQAAQRLRDLAALWKSIK